MKKKIIEQVLCDTTREVPFEEYSDYCQDMDELPTEDGYADYCSDARLWEWDDFMENLPYMFGNDCYWMITGHLGLWNGTHDVYPTMEKSLEDAIRACIGRSTDDVIIKRKDNMLIVVGLHHDGRNYFELHALTDKGVERFERHGEVSLLNRENVQKLPSFLL